MIVRLNQMIYSQVGYRKKVFCIILRIYIKSKMKNINNCFQVELIEIENAAQ
jgi:hypothetical protein